MKICLVYTLAPFGKGIYRKLKVPISRIDGEKISCLPHTYMVLRIPKFLILNPDFLRCVKRLF